MESVTLNLLSQQSRKVVISDVLIECMTSILTRKYQYDIILYYIKSTYIVHPGERLLKYHLLAVQLESTAVLMVNLGQ